MTFLLLSLILRPMDFTSIYELNLIMNGMRRRTRGACNFLRKITSRDSVENVLSPTAKDSRLPPLSLLLGAFHREDFDLDDCDPEQSLAGCGPEEAGRIPERSEDDRLRLGAVRVSFQNSRSLPSPNLLIPENSTLRTGPHSVWPGT